MKHIHLFVMAIFLLAACSHNSNSSTSKEQPKKDTIAQRDTTSDDSLYEFFYENEHWVTMLSKEEYEQEKHEQDSINNTVIVFVQKGDSVFHLVPSCKLLNLKHSHFTNVYKARKGKLKVCKECVSNIVFLACRYSDDVIHEDDIYEWMSNNEEAVQSYVYDNYEKFLPDDK